MPCCEISDCAQMSKTIIAVRHFGLGGRESLETAVNLKAIYFSYGVFNLTTYLTRVIKNTGKNLNSFFKFHKETSKILPTKLFLIYSLTFQIYL